MALARILRRFLAANSICAFLRDEVLPNGMNRLLMLSKVTPVLSICSTAAFYIDLESILNIATISLSFFAKSFRPVALSNTAVLLAKMSFAA